jgi:hypothetical protein
MYKKFFNRGYFKSLCLLFITLGYLSPGLIINAQEVSADGNLAKGGLAINISTNKRVYRFGEPIKLDIKFQNVNKRKNLHLVFPAKYSVPKNINISKKYWDSLCLLSQEKISLMVERISTGRKAPFVGSPFVSSINPTRVKLKRGEAHHVEISDVSKFYEITRLGSYHIVLKYAFGKEKKRYGGIWKGTLYSNIVKITIKK